MHMVIGQTTKDKGLSLGEAWAMIEVAGATDRENLLAACGLPENSFIRKENYDSTGEPGLGRM